MNPNIEVTQGYAPLDKIAELVAQMDSYALKLFIKEYDITFDNIVKDNWDRMTARAKSYDGLYFGLLTMFLTNDYTAAREVMLRADSGKLDVIDDHLRRLFLRITELRNEDALAGIADDILSTYRNIYTVLTSAITEWDLHSGYFRRNGKSLKEDWDDLLMYDNRINHNIQVREAMYGALWNLIKLRVYMISTLPKIELNYG